MKGPKRIMCTITKLFKEHHIDFIDRGDLTTNKWKIIKSIKNRTANRRTYQLTIELLLSQKRAEDYFENDEGGLMSDLENILAVTEIESDDLQDKNILITFKTGFMPDIGDCDG